MNEEKTSGGNCAVSVPDIVERLRVHCGLYEESSRYCGEAADEIEQLTNEVMEQARLNGMGAERELALRTEIERLREQVNVLRELREIDQKLIAALEPKP